MFEDLRNWFKGAIIGLGLCLLFYFFQLTILLYKDSIFSSLNKKVGFAYFYSLMSIESMLLVFTFLIVTSIVIGAVMDFKEMHHV